MRLKGDALEWYTRNVERHDRPIRDWSLEAVIEGLQKCFLNTFTHRQVSYKFDTIEQGKWTVQELYQDLTKYAACMVQYPDEYSCRRRLIATLRPLLQKEVLHRGITAEFSSIEDILEKAKDIEDSSQYDIGSRNANDSNDVTTTAYKPTVRTSKPMFYPTYKTAGHTWRNHTLVSHPQMTAKASNSCPHIASSTGAPLKEGELRYYECRQRGHIKPQCTKLKGKQRVARVQIEDLIEEDEELSELLTSGAPDDALEAPTYP